MFNTISKRLSGHFLLSVLLLTPALGYGAQKNIYQVNLVARDKRGFSMFTQFMGSWHCSTTSVLKYSEAMRDHKGQLKKVPVERKGDFNPSTLFFGQPSVQMMIESNTLNQSPTLKAQLNQHCTRESCKDEYNYQTGKSETNCGTISIFKSWICNISDLPNQAYEPQRTNCKVAGVTLPTSLDDVIHQVALQDISVDAYIQLKGQREDFLYSNCGRDKKNARIIRIDQGLSGRKFENDFEVTIKVGNDTVKVPTSSG